MPQQQANGKDRIGRAGDLLDAPVGAHQNGAVGLHVRRAEGGHAGTEAQAEQHQGAVRKALPSPLDDGHRVLHQRFLRRLAVAFPVATVVHQQRGGGAAGELVHVHGDFLGIAAAVDDERRLRWRIGVHDPAAQHGVAALNRYRFGRGIPRLGGELLRMEDELVLQRPQQGAQQQVQPAQAKAEAERERNHFRQRHGLGRCGLKLRVVLAP